MRELAELVHRADRLSASELVYRPLPQDDPKQRQPDISLAETQLRMGARRGAARGPGPDHRLFRRFAAAERQHHLVCWF